MMNEENVMERMKLERKLSKELASRITPKLVECFKLGMKLDEDDLTTHEINDIAEERAADIAYNFIGDKISRKLCAKDNCMFSNKFWPGKDWSDEGE